MLRNIRSGRRHVQCHERRQWRQELTIKVRDLPPLPLLRHLLQLRPLPQHRVRDLGAKSGRGDIEGSKCDRSRAPLGDHVVCVATLVLRKRDKKALSVGKEELKGDVSEEVLPLVHLEQVIPVPAAAPVRDIERLKRLFRVAAGEFGQRLQMFVALVCGSIPCVDEFTVGALEVVVDNVEVLLCKEKKTGWACEKRNQYEK